MRLNENPDKGIKRNIQHHQRRQQQQQQSIIPSHFNPFDLIPFKCYCWCCCCCCCSFYTVYFVPLSSRVVYSHTLTQTHTHTHWFCVLKCDSDKSNRRFFPQLTLLYRNGTPLVQPEGMMRSGLVAREDADDNPTRMGGNAEELLLTTLAELPRRCLW